MKNFLAITATHDQGAVDYEAANAAVIAEMLSRRVDREEIYETLGAIIESSRGSHKKTSFVFSGNASKAYMPSSFMRGEDKGG